METLLEVKKSTGITPHALRNRPALKPQYRQLLEAFYEVSAGRSVGDMPHPIRAGDIRDYLDLMNVQSQAERERFFVAIRRMDAVYLSVIAEKLKEESPK